MTKRRAEIKRVELVETARTFINEIYKDSSNKREFNKLVYYLTESSVELSKTQKDDIRTRIKDFQDVHKKKEMRLANFEPILEALNQFYDGSFLYLMKPSKSSNWRNILMHLTNDIIFPGNIQIDFRNKEDLDLMKRLKVVFQKYLEYIYSNDKKIVDENIKNVIGFFDLVEKSALRRRNV